VVEKAKTRWNWSGGLVGRESEDPGMGAGETKKLQGSGALHRERRGKVSSTVSVLCWAFHPHWLSLETTRFLPPAVMLFSRRIRIPVCLSLREANTFKDTPSSLVLMSHC
jgi:hypothetical protein